ncbi:MAG: hypothetical protein AB1Z98_01310 [Nannocystaceae bacterium]
MRAAWIISAAISLTFGACGGDDSSNDSAAEGSGSSGGTASTGTPPATTADGSGTTSGASGSGSATGGSTDDTGEPGSSGPPPVLLDVGVIPDAPPPVCGGAGSGDLSLSYIWIANSAQGTISKIDTSSMIEEGRYQARPFNGDPSRTSVNLVGDVAVANRNGGVTKFWANQDDCVDSNGTPGIQTSTGPGDVLAWEQDDCMAWHTPLNCSSNRPVAWTRGEFNEAECTFENMDLWTACDSQVLLLDGETGAIEETVNIPGGGFVFVYGGAADADGNFWGIDTGNGQLFRVESGTLDYDTWALPFSGGYGITVDSIGRPWVCGGGGVSRFDLVAQTWDSTGGSGIGGCMTDGADLIWHSNNSGLLMGFNINTLNIDEQIQLPEYVHGISVDFQGMVWGVSFAGSNAYRADPVTGAIDTYGGLIGAYTYSDMTGFALSTAGGGGNPPM